MVWQLPGLSYPVPRLGERLCNHCDAAFLFRGCTVLNLDDGNMVLTKFFGKVPIVIMIMDP